MGACFKRSVTLPSESSGVPALPNIGVSSLKKNDQIGRDNTHGEGLAGSPLLMRTRFDLERPHSVW